MRILVNAGILLLFAYVGFAFYFLVKCSVASGLSGDDKIRSQNIYPVNLLKLN